MTLATEPLLSSSGAPHPRRVSGAVCLYACVAAFTLSTLGCKRDEPQAPPDEGKTIYDTAVRLEEQAMGRAEGYISAANEYDKVCRRVPDSKFCIPSQERGSMARLKAAESFIKDGKYQAAKTELDLLSAGRDDSEPTRRAKAHLASEDVREGVDFESLSSKPNDVASIRGLVNVATSKSRFAEKARELLNAHPDQLQRTIEADCKSSGPGGCVNTGECSYSDIESCLRLCLFAWEESSAKPPILACSLAKSHEVELMTRECSTLRREKMPAERMERWKMLLRLERAEPGYPGLMGEPGLPATDSSDAYQARFDKACDEGYYNNPGRNPLEALANRNK